MKTLAVFCGSSPGRVGAYVDGAKQLGNWLGENGFDIVYGGGMIGMMGAIADAAMAAGSHVTGIIPDFLARKEIAHQGIHRLEVVENMHVRKRKMYEMCDGVLILPGGFGTLDEMFEIITWSQLGQHTKPVGVWNQLGYFNQLIAFSDHMCSEGFMDPSTRNLLLQNEDYKMLIRQMQQWQAPPSPGWLSLEKI
jgi:uncharacterized protein (TIGR00730 family)